MTGHRTSENTFRDSLPRVDETGSEADLRKGFVGEIPYFKNFIKEETFIKGRNIKFSPLYQVFKSSDLRICRDLFFLK